MFEAYITSKIIDVLVRQERRDYFTTCGDKRIVYQNNIPNNDEKVDDKRNNTITSDGKFTVMLGR